MWTVGGSYSVKSRVSVGNFTYERKVYVLREIQVWYYFKLIRKESYNLEVMETLTAHLGIIKTKQLFTWNADYRKEKLRMTS